jgi:hypothetical protein
MAQCPAPRWAQRKAAGHLSESIHNRSISDRPHHSSGLYICYSFNVFSQLSLLIFLLCLSLILLEACIHKLLDPSALLLTFLHILLHILLLFLRLLLLLMSPTHVHTFPISLLLYISIIPPFLHHQIYYTYHSPSLPVLVLFVPRPSHSPVSFSYSSSFFSFSRILFISCISSTLPL